MVLDVPDEKQLLTAMSFSVSTSDIVSCSLCDRPLLQFFNCAYHLSCWNIFS